MKLREEENFIEESYDSIGEFLKVTGKRKKAYFGDPSEDNHFMDECGCKREEAVRRIYDTRKGLGVFQKIVKKETEALGSVKRRKSFPSMYGGQPLVANHVMGLPLTMLHQERIKSPQKIRDVHINGEYPWTITHEEVLKYFGEVVALLQYLEKQGNRVRITLFYTFSSTEVLRRGGYPNKMHCCKIILKKESEPFSLRRLLYPLSNDGMLRGFLFRWYETLNGAQRLGGYGTPSYIIRKENPRTYRNMEEAFNLPKDYIYYGCDYKSVLEN